MRKEEVLKRIGKANWRGFCRFMRGQTVSVYSDGAIDYYECDVENFLRKPKDRVFD